ncbi:MAG: hypothetical protein M1829_005404 [Trizodia sp. TS-e1964]|nr:MAG: hypothetical protein M1829_005404 [Trizodia sp. TS-e1964]
MAKKRRRAQSPTPHARKRAKHADKLATAPGSSKGGVLEHSVLLSYFPRVLTLREYLLSKLPASSKSRRRKILSLGPADKGTGKCLETGELAKLLDTALIGIARDAQEEDGQARRKELLHFSQKQLAATNQSSTSSGVTCSQSDIVDFVIGQLFNRIQRAEKWAPPHLLCHGYERCGTSRRNHPNNTPSMAIQGLVSFRPNTYVQTIKGPLWAAILSLLAAEGERIMIDLLMDCSIFIPLGAGRANFYQLSGSPLYDMPTLSGTDIKGVAPSKSPQALADKKLRTIPSPSCTLRTPCQITIVRNRMLYARPTLNARGAVYFGLQHIHVLNRFPNCQSLDDTTHIMKYIFPRQFGLHNVFTSLVDKRETVQAFKDYTLREEGITAARVVKAHNPQSKETSAVEIKTKIPKRLRGIVVELVTQLRKRHSRCSYSSLLRHYCHTPEFDGEPKTRRAVGSSIAQGVASVDLSTTTFNPPPNEEESVCPTKRPLIMSATPSAHVSAFCRGVIGNIIPDRFWGDGEAGAENRATMMKNIDLFVNLRRFESISLQEAVRGMKITPVSWLRPPTEKAPAKLCKSEFEKRWEIFLEFIYYIYDSILIPLIRCNFHVTESNVHRNRLFYFRHDVWRSISEPSLALLKLSNFEEQNTLEAQRILNSRAIGYSQVRLLPKECGVRPIINLKRRVATLKNGRMLLGRSINSVMAPVYNMLNYEKVLSTVSGGHVELSTANLNFQANQPERTGSSLFSVTDIYTKLKGYKQSLRKNGYADVPLHFVKVDVQSCFDTIPQDKMLELIESLVQEEQYQIQRHAEIMPAEGPPRTLKSTTKPARKFLANAHAAGPPLAFTDTLKRTLAPGKHHTVFIDQGPAQAQSSSSLLHLLREHVQHNMVKIGRKFYRQKAGIPQGSVVSSLLCNFFYADLERTSLGFLVPGESLLLRLIDDFLLITPRREHAQRFLDMMLAGNVEYGVAVAAHKSLVNFDARVPADGKSVARLPGGQFPYCGTLIDVRTLEISRDRERGRGAGIADSLTIEYSKVPGKTFQRKVLNSIKLHMQRMFLDTAHNSYPLVVRNVYYIFAESARKMALYQRQLARRAPSPPHLIQRSIMAAADLAFALIRGREKCGAEGYRCSLSKAQVAW